MSSSRFRSSDFKYYILQEIESKKNQKLCSYLRSLSKSNNSLFGAALNCANVDYLNLKNLAGSKFSEQIQKLYISNVEYQNLKNLINSQFATLIQKVKVSIPSDLNSIDDNENIQLDDLCYIATQYLKNITSVKLQFFKTQYMGHNITMDITQNLSFRGLNIEKNSGVYMFRISGEHDLDIQNCKFEGLQIQPQAIKNIKIKNVEFLNTQDYQFGLSTLYCSSVTLQNIRVKKCGGFLEAEGCQKLVISNIYVQNCGFNNNALEIFMVPSFEITDSNISSCNSALRIDTSQGINKNLIVSNHLMSAITLISSKVHCQQFYSTDGLIEEEEDDDDYLVALFDSQFIQGV